MVCLRDCPACQYGRHSDHVENFAPAPSGVMGGAACPCKGECVSRPAWYGVPASVLAELARDADFDPADCC